MERSSTSFLLGIINFFVGLAEVVLLVRVLLRLFNAHSSAPFVHWVYQTSDTLMTPFRGIFPAETVSGGYTIDFSALFAMLMYALGGFLLTQLVSALTGPVIVRKK